jgi:hypothetical protein
MPHVPAQLRASARRPFSQTLHSSYESNQASQVAIRSTDNVRTRSQQRWYTHTMRLSNVRACTNMETLATALRVQQGHSSTYPAGPARKTDMGTRSVANLMLAFKDYSILHHRSRFRSSCQTTYSRGAWWVEGSLQHVLNTQISRLPMPKRSRLRSCRVPGVLSALGLVINRSVTDEAVDDRKRRM